LPGNFTEIVLCYMLKLLHYAAVFQSPVNSTAVEIILANRPHVFIVLIMRQEFPVLYWCSIQCIVYTILYSNCLIHVILLKGINRIFVSL